jgi:alanine-synthesizing transaminase
MLPMTIQAATHIPVARRVGGFVYAIRNIVAEAKKVEAAGRQVRYLNIGDPVAFGFQPPAHLVAAVERAMRDGQNAYTPSPGIMPAREAVAADYTARGVPMTVPTYPLYTAVCAKLGARAVYYRTDPARGWAPDVDHIRSLITPSTRALVVIDPNNPTGATYREAVRRDLLQLADRHGFVLLADEVYGDLAYTGPVPPMAALDPSAPVVSFGSLSKAYLAPGWRAGWLAVGKSERLDGVLGAIFKLADGRVCSNGPMQHAIAAALTMDRSHQIGLRAALHERATLTTTRLNSIEGISCVAPQAAFYAMPRVALPPGKTDEDYVLGLLRSKGVLCVYGSGFGLPAADGFMRVVFLAAPAELASIYDDIAAFTREFLSR